MTCEEARDALTLVIDGEGDEHVKSCALDHIAICPACERHKQAIEVQETRLRLLASLGAGSCERITNRVMSQLPARLSPRRPYRVWLAGMGGVAAGFLLALAMFRPWEMKSDSHQGFTQGNRSEIAVQGPAASHDLSLEVARAPMQFLCPTDKDWKNLDRGQSAPVGSRLRTPPDLRCELRAADGTCIRMNGDTEVVYTAPRQMELARGQIMAKVVQSTELFRVMLSGLSLTSLGTEFDLDCQPNRAVLTVMRGQADIKGETFDATVKEGQQATVTNGHLREHGPVDPFSLVLASRWVNEILLMKGNENPELASRVNDVLAQLGHLKSNYLGEEEIRSLGDRCVLPLSQYLQSPRSRGADQEPRRHSAARILSDLAQPWSIPDLIALLESTDGEVRYQAARGLHRLTQLDQEFPITSWKSAPKAQQEQARARWRKWWSANKSRFPIAPA